MLFVGVRCPLEVVVAREAARTDRTIGQAAAQFDVVHRAGGYDLEVDTSVLDADEAAERIASASRAASRRRRSAGWTPSPPAADQPAVTRLRVEVAALGAAQPRPGVLAEVPTW